MDRISLRYRVATRLERLLIGLRGWTSQSVAFLLGIVLNTVTDSGLKNPGNPLSVLSQVYSDRRVSGYAAWLATAAFAAVVGGRPLLERYTRRWNWLGILSMTFADARDPSLSWLDESTLAWGTEIMLQSPPDLREGWRAASVELVISQPSFRLPSRQMPAFRRFVEAQNAVDPQRIVARAPKFGLARNPASFTDNPSLRLEIVETQYAHVMFYKDKIAPNTMLRTDLARAVLDERRIGFPHNLCLHAVVATSDGKLLLTRRSPKVEYFPGHWSCSLEEQLAARDLEPDDGGAVLRWVTRALTEELGFRDRTLRQWYGGDATILGVIMESAILNCGLIGLIHLRCDSVTLAKILRTHRRDDDEFSAYDFVGWEDIARELVDPSRPYHPTSGIRMLTAGIAHFGPHAFLERLVDARIIVPDKSAAP